MVADRRGVREEEGGKAHSQPPKEEEDEDRESERQAVRATFLGLSFFSTRQDNTLAG